MIYFSTLYKVRDNEYSSFIYAVNRQAADKIIQIRNIGERIIGELIRVGDINPSPLPSDFYLERSLMACVHTLTFYGWLASRAGVVPYIADVMLRDDGILHEVMHELHHPEDFGFRDDVFKQMLELEAVIPGLNTWNGKKPFFERGADRRKTEEALTA